MPQMQKCRNAEMQKFSTLDIGNYGKIEITNVDLKMLRFRPKKSKT
jgi:hypothetical protein